MCRYEVPWLQGSLGGCNSPKMEQVDRDALLSGYQIHPCTCLPFFNVSSLLRKEHTGQHLDNSIL